MRKTLDIDAGPPLESRPQAIGGPLALGIGVRRAARARAAARRLPGLALRPVHGLRGVAALQAARFALPWGIGVARFVAQSLAETGAATRSSVPAPMGGAASTNRRSREGEPAATWSFGLRMRPMWRRAASALQLMRAAGAVPEGPTGAARVPVPPSMSELRADPGAHFGGEPEAGAAAAGLVMAPVTPEDEPSPLRASSLQPLAEPEPGRGAAAFAMPFSFGLRPLAARHAPWLGADVAAADLRVQRSAMSAPLPPERSIAVPGAHGPLRAAELLPDPTPGSGDEAIDEAPVPWRKAVSTPTLGSIDGLREPTNDAGVTTATHDLGLEVPDPGPSMRPMLVGLRTITAGVREVVVREVASQIGTAIAEVERAARAAAPPSPPPVDFTSEHFVRTLISRIRALTHEERFRAGLIR